MMFVISPLLASSRWSRCRSRSSSPSRSRKRSQKQFIAQWKHTGALNGQIEEAFTGHAAGQGVRPPRARSKRRSTRRTRSCSRPASGRSSSPGIIMPAMMFIGNLNYVAIAVVGGLRVASGSMQPRRRAGVHPVLAPVHPAADPAGVDGQPAAVRRRVGRARLRAARRRRADRPTRRRPAELATPHGRGSRSSTSRSATTRSVR